MSADILFFDGTCNLCNGFVDFLIRRSPSFSFASLQGSTARRVLPEDLTKELSTVVYFRDGKFHQRSVAVALIFYDLGGIYRVLFLALKILPSFFSDGVYRFISERRYKLFGKRDSCRLPAEEERSFFLP